MNSVQRIQSQIWLQECSIIADMRSGFPVSNVTIVSPEVSLRVKDCAPFFVLFLLFYFLFVLYFLFLTIDWSEVLPLPSLFPFPLFRKTKVKSFVCAQIGRCGKLSILTGERVDFCGDKNKSHILLVEQIRGMPLYVTHTKPTIKYFNFKTISVGSSVELGRPFREGFKNASHGVLNPLQ